MYRWRQLGNEERRQELRRRQVNGLPLHSPRHVDSGSGQYLITAACYEHAAHIGHSTQRMTQFSDALLEVLRDQEAAVCAWVLLPNHYHILACPGEILPLLKALGQLHGRTSFLWNGEENTRGRKVWCNAVETAMKSEAHSWATVNYIHQNPVKHGYVAKWQDWPWSSADEYLREVGREEAERRWRAFPVGSYGKGWDDAAL